MAKVNRRDVAADMPPPPSLTQPSTRRGEARHSALLDAAREVFLEKGYAAASIEDVVARVGGSKASVYSYFGSKEGLFLAIIEAACERFLADMSVPETLDRPVEVELTEFARRAVKRMLDPHRVRVFRTLIAESIRFPAMAERLYQSGPQRLHAQLGRYLRIADAAGRIRCPEPEMAAIQFIEMIKGHAQYRALLGLPPFASGAGAEKTIAFAVGTFMKAMAP